MTTKNLLDSLKGESVAVWWSPVGEAARASFDTSISVAGELQCHPEGDQWRVVSDVASYAYFDLDDVVQIVDGRPLEHKFKGGQSAVIRLGSA